MGSVFLRVSNHCVPFDGFKVQRMKFLHNVVYALSSSASVNNHILASLDWLEVNIDVTVTSMAL